MDARWFWVCLGGAAGTAARYWVAGWAPHALGAGFPFATLFVNALGSFLLGVVLQIGLSGELLPTTARVALSVGVLGGFTTYSTFCYETLEYLREGQWWTGSLYTATTVFGSLATCALGVATAKALAGG
jgi:fluoride exporter